MINYAWLTDIHLDHMRSDQDIIALFERVKSTNCDGVILSGDISTAHSIVLHLGLVEKVLQRPIYFVLGNHDYYGGSIEEVRKQMKDLGKLSPYLKYLSNSTYYMLNSSTAIVGHDTWYDVINGEGPRSRFKLNDFRLIKEYCVRGSANPLLNSDILMKDIVEVSRNLSHEGVLHIQKGIKEAFRYARTVIVVSHVPPYAESHMYKGRVGSDEAQPWFTCKLLGDMLRDAVKAFPDRKIISLSGHSHGGYRGVLHGVDVRVGGAEYGIPQIEEIISI